MGIHFPESLGADKQLKFFQAKKKRKSCYIIPEEKSSDREKSIEDSKLFVDSEDDWDPAANKGEL